MPIKPLIMYKIWYWEKLWRRVVISLGYTIHYGRKKEQGFVSIDACKAWNLRESCSQILLEAIFLAIPRDLDWLEVRFDGQNRNFGEAGGCPELPGRPGRVWLLSCPSHFWTSSKRASALKQRGIVIHNADVGLQYHLERVALINSHQAMV